MRYVIIIVPRKSEDACMDYLRRQGVLTVFSTLCHGTARQKTLDYLGIENTDKTMLFAVMPVESARRLQKGLIAMNIDAPGNGIAMTVPLNGIGGASALQYLTYGQETIIGGGKKMDSIQFALIIAIAESGCTDIVMDAARSANARGGTVIHVKGTSDEAVSKFLGVSIASEKEMILIVTKHQDRDNIMHAIMEKAGRSTDARAAVFSLPVDSVVGLRSVLEDTEN